MDTDIENKLKEFLKITAKTMRVKKIINYPELVAFLQTKYPKYDLKWQVSLFNNGFEKEPCCVLCEGALSLPTRVRTVTCSAKCRDELKRRDGTFDAAHEKRKVSNLEKYGFESHNSSPEIQQKRKDTMMEKYGALVSPKSRERMKNEAVNLNKIGRATLLERYGVTNPGQMPDHGTKIKATYQEKYGVDHYTKTAEFQQMYDQRRLEKWINFTPPNITFVDMATHQDKVLLFNNPNKIISFICNTCGKEDSAPTETYKWRVNNCQTPCCNCAELDTGSAKEAAVANFIASLALNCTIIRNDRILLANRELDIYLPDKQIAIEFNGLFWHNDLIMPKNYHLDKMLKCQSKNVRLVTIFEDEWDYHPEVVKSRLQNILGVTTEKVYARKCTIQEIPFATEKDFLNKYHLQGHSNSSIKVGLYHNMELVAVMTFSKPNASKGQTKAVNKWELLRFCSSVNVVGGASKLLKYFIQHYDPNEIISFCDLRWGSGEVYHTLGFQKVSDGKPGYWYFKGTKRVHRYGLRKKKDEPKDKTEYELRLSEGYHRIWDCGHSKWLWTKKPPH